MIYLESSQCECGRRNEPLTTHSVWLLTQLRLTCVGEVGEEFGEHVGAGEDIRRDE